MSDILVAVCNYQDVNTGLIMLIWISNFINSPLSFLGSIVPNLYSYVSSYWYPDVGYQVVASIIIGAFMTYLTISISLVTRYRHIYLDGFSTGMHITTRDSIWYYVVRYSTPDAVLPILYAILMNKMDVSLFVHLVYMTFLQVQIWCQNQY